MASAPLALVLTVFAKVLVVTSLVASPEFKAIVLVPEVPFTAVDVPITRLSMVAPLLMVAPPLAVNAPVRVVAPVTLKLPPTLVSPVMLDVPLTVKLFVAEVVPMVTLLLNAFVPVQVLFAASKSEL